jgi:group I intron endonuclease
MFNHCGVYKITNLKNNKCYIGSSINIIRRWGEHKRHLINNKHTNIHLQKSWNKHGENSFLFEIIEYVENKENLVNREQYYLDEFKKCNSKILYNLCPVAYSALGFKHSKDTKNKMSESHKGLTHKKDTIIKMIKNKNKQSKQTKDKLSEINKGRTPQNKQPIYQIDLNNNILKQWDCVTDAAKTLNLSPSLICSVCRGKRKTTGGFKWKYLNETTQKTINSEEVKNKYSTGLYSTRELAKIYNISKSRIWDIVK